MPGRRNNSLKDPKLYEELRDDGASEEKAARIRLTGYSKQRKSELISALGNH